MALIKHYRLATQPFTQLCQRNFSTHVNTEAVNEIIIEHANTSQNQIVQSFQALPPERKQAFKNMLALKTEALKDLEEQYEKMQHMMEFTQE